MAIRNLNENGNNLEEAGIRQWLSDGESVAILEKCGNGDGGNGNGEKENRRSEK